MTADCWAIYDNPATCRREEWRDGLMVAFVTADLLCQREVKSFIPITSWARQPSWQPGNVIGDQLAVGPLNPTVGHP